MATTRLWLVGVALSTTLSGCDLLEDWLNDHGGGGGGGWHDTDDDSSSHDTDDDSSSHDTDHHDTDVHDTGDTAEEDSGETGEVDDTGDSAVEDTGEEDTGDTGEDDSDSDDTDKHDTDDGWVDTDDDTGDTGDTGDVKDTGAEDTGDTGDTGEEDGCTKTQGFWKNHGPDAPGNNQNLWPVTSLQLGSVSYTDDQLKDIFDTPVAGNGLISLAHQLIAAKLNVAAGADDTDIASTIAAADALIDGLVIPPVGSGYLDPATTSALVDALTDFNEGRTGPGHCRD